MNKYICPTCGKEYVDLNNDLNFCSECGTKIVLNEVENDDEEVTYSHYNEDIDLNLIFDFEENSFEMYGDVFQENIEEKGKFSVNENGIYTLYIDDDTEIMEVSLDSEKKEFQVIEAYTVQEYENTGESIDLKLQIAFGTNEFVLNGMYFGKEINFEGYIVKEDDEYLLLNSAERKLMNITLNNEKFEVLNFFDENDESFEKVSNQAFYCPKAYQVYVNSLNRESILNISKILARENKIEILDAKKLLYNFPTVIKEFDNLDDAKEFVGKFNGFQIEFDIRKNEDSEEISTEELDEEIYDLLTDEHLEELTKEYDNYVLESADSEFIDLFYSKHAHLLTNEQKLILPVDKYLENLKNYKERIIYDVNEYNSYLNTARKNHNNLIFLKNKKKIKISKVFASIFSVISFACTGVLVFLFLESFEMIFKEKWIDYIFETKMYKYLCIGLCALAIFFILTQILSLIINSINGFRKTIKIIYASENSDIYMQLRDEYNSGNRKKVNKILKSSTKNRKKLLSELFDENKGCE